MKKEIKLFIFDMDGLMFDTEPISAQCWQAAAAQFGYDVPDEAFFAVLGMNQITAGDVFRRFLGSDFPYETVRRVKLAYQERYYQEHDIPVKAGLEQCLDYARQKKIACAVASSSPLVQIRYLLKKTGLLPYFTLLQSGEEIAHGKPAPDIFLTACRHLSVAPSQAVVFEDSAIGLQAAHAADIAAVWIPDLGTVPEDVAGAIWFRCASLAEVPQRLEREKEVIR